MATLNQALDILDRLKATNDPRYDSYRATVQQGLDNMSQPEYPPYQPPPGPHQLPTQTDYLGDKSFNFLGTDFNMGALAPMLEYGQGVKDYLFPPSQEEIVSRPYTTEPRLNPFDTFGRDFSDATQDVATGAIDAYIDAPYTSRDEWDRLLELKHGRRGDVSQIDPVLREAARIQSGMQQSQAREAMVGGARDVIEQGLPIALPVIEDGRLTLDMEGNLFRTPQQRAADVPLTSEQAMQKTWMPGVSYGAGKSFTRSAALMLPALITFMATKNPSAAMAAFAAPVYGETYGRLKKEGMDPIQAHEDAKKATLFEVLPEILTFGVFKFIRRPLMAFLAGIPAEAASEVLTELGYVQDEIRNKGAEFNPDQIMERLKHAAIMGGYMGLGFGGAVTAPAAIERIKNLKTGTAEDALNYIRAFKQQAIERGMAQSDIAILTEVEAQLGDHSLSELERMDALNMLETMGTKGAFYQPFNTRKAPGDGGFINQEAWAREGTPVSQIEGSGVAVFHSDYIFQQLRREAGYGRVSKNAVNDRMQELILHELGIHGGLRKTFVSLGMDDADIAKFYARIRKENAAELEAWLSTPEGSAYADGGFDEIAEEFLANAVLNKHRAGGQFVRLIKKTLKKQAGFDINTAQASEIVAMLAGRVEAGDMSPVVPTEEAPTDTSPRLAKGDPVDPSRRRFMKQVGGAVAGAAVDPSILLEPATQEAEVASTFGGMAERFPGSIYEFSIAVDPNAGWTSADDPAEGAIDVAFTHDPNTNEVMVYEGSEVVDTFEVDDMHADAEVLEYVRDQYGRANINDARVQREEMERDPITGEGGFDYWGDADNRFDDMALSVIKGEKTMAGVERVERGPAYDIFQEPETPRVEEETVEKTDAELYVETIDEIMSIYDEDATAAEAAADGSLNDRIISYAAETPFTREELWEGVNQRIEALEDTGTRFAKRAADMTEAEKLNRDVRYDFARGPYKEIVGREDEADVRARIKRLGNLYGPMGQKRGIEPGDRATAKEQAQNAIDNVDAFEEFMAPFEAQIKEQPARSRTATGRQEKYAQRKGITVADILSYRERGKIHPMEKKMSYTFGTEEIDRLEAEGEITADEAETRRRTLNDLRNQLGGKMPPGAKRKATEIVYGIGDYANIEAWGYTEAETAGMGERAEVARGQERVRGLRRTEKTEKELEEITGSDVTPIEMMQISAMREVEAFDRFTTDMERLTYLREKEAMPASERRALDAFMRDMRGWDEAAYEAQLAAEREAQVQKVGVTRVKQTAAQRKAELKSMKEAQAPIEKRKHIQVEPDFFETLEDPMFTIQGESIPEGYMELTEEGEVAEVDDPSTRFARAGEGTRMTEKTRDYFIKTKYFGLKLDHDNLDSKGRPKIIENDIGKIYWKYDDNGIIVPWEHKWGLGSMEEVTQARDLLDAGTIKLGVPLNLGNAINRRLDDRASQGYGYSGDQGIPSLKTLNKKIIDILRKIYTKEGIDRTGRVTTFEHLRRKLGERTVTGKRVIDAWRTDEFGPTMSFILTDFMQGRERSWNIALVHPIPDSVKTAWQEGIPFQSKGEREGRLNSSQPYTEALKFLDLGAKLVKAEAAPKNDNEKHAIAFYNKMTSKYGNDIRVKLKKYIETMRTMKPESVATTIIKSVLGWEGVSDIPKDLLSEVGDLNRSLYDIHVQSEKGITEPLAKVAADTMSRFAKRAKGDSYEEHFNKNFWYTLTSYLWGKPVQAIRDFNKLSRFGQAKADVPAADEIADEVQRAHSSTQRAEPLIYGTDIVQDTSIRTGQFFTRLAQIFSRVTARLGDIETRENQMLVDILTGKVRIEELDNAEHREAAKLLRELMQDVYNYAKTETKGLKDPLDLRGHGDTLLPRVWNIEFLATRRGKAKFLKAIRAAISDPATGSSILEDADLTVEDLYNVVVNSGGFVQGDWTNLKADQTRNQKEIDRDIKAQEYLDALPTESLVDEDLVMIDLQAIIPRFIQKAVERTEYSKRFGVNDEILRAKIKEGLEQIKEHNAKVLKLDKTDKSLTYIDPKAFEKSVWDMARILRNKYGYDMANMQTRAWLQRVVNFEVVAKLPLVTLASMPELFTPMLRGSVRPDKFVVDLMAGFVWAGYKGMNGISKLLLNKHLPAMRKASAEIGGIGVISDVQLLRELGIAEIQAMGDAVSTRYANPNFARGGLRAGARTTIAGRIPKKVRAVFNMQTYMQATLLTTLTEMQQLMALRNFQRHMAKRVKFVQKNAGKDLKGRRLRLFKQFSKDMADFGLPQNIDLDTAAGEAEFNAGAIRFVDQVITRPNDATTAKAFKNPLTAPIFLFKRFITTFGNTLMTAVGNDIATKVDNVEKAKQVGRIMAAVTAMYGAVMFAEIMRAAIKGDLDEDDMKIGGGDFRTFMRRIDRTGLLSAPGAMILNLAFPYKRGWWDSPEARIWGELGGPIGGDISQLMKTGFDRRPGSAQRLIRQMIPMSKQLVDLPPKKKRKSSKNTVLQMK
jgi:hypothetical protein